MATIAVIPARLASTRFPGKPLADIHGIPMVMHCYLRTKAAKLIDRVYIATCDEEISEVATSLGALVVMTSDQHINAIDRTAEAFERIRADSDDEIGIVVLVQGDEPLLNPEDLDAIVEKMEQDPSLGIVNIMVPFKSTDDFTDENKPKVVTDANLRALYMSREPIPSNWHGWSDAHSHMQTGLFGFRPESLEWFAQAPRSPLELIESIDMLRVLQSGRVVQMIRAEESTIGVDTPANLDEVRALMPTDRLFGSYREGSEARPAE